MFRDGFAPPTSRGSCTLGGKYMQIAFRENCCEEGVTIIICCENSTVIESLTSGSLTLCHQHWHNFAPFCTNGFTRVVLFLGNLFHAEIQTFVCEDLLYFTIKCSAPPPHLKKHVLFYPEIFSSKLCSLKFLFSNFIPLKNYEKSYFLNTLYIFNKYHIKIIFILR